MLELNITRNTNTNLQATNYNPVGKYYARVEPKQTYSLRQLAKHMHQHNTAFSAGLIVGVLTDMVTCIKELALVGCAVKIDDLGIFKCSVEANGMTLSSGAKISAGQGSQRTDAELTADITKQQFAVSSVKLIMQASGETTKDDMSGDARLQFTSKAKALIKSLTGNDANAPANGSGDTSGPDTTSPDDGE